MADPTTGGNAGGSSPEARVREDAERARAQVDREVGSAQESLSEARRLAEERARSFVGDATQQARSYADSQKEAAAQSLQDFAEAVRRASDELGKRDQTLAARFVQEAAGSLESMSRSVGSRNVDSMLDAVRDFGRSNPTAFIAGSVLAGIAIGRFARSSDDRDYQRYGHYFAGSNPGAGGRQGTAAPRPTSRPGAGASATTGSAAGQARSPSTPSKES